MGPGCFSILARYFKEYRVCSRCFLVSRSFSGGIDIPEWTVKEGKKKCARLRFSARFLHASDFDVLVSHSPTLVVLDPEFSSI